MRAHAGLLMIAALGVLGVDLVHPLPLVEPAALGVAVISAAFVRPLGHVARYGDFSYGLYILHFPVIQLLVQSGWLMGRPVALFVTACGAAFAGAVCLWYLVEKPCLLEGSHYRTPGGGRV
jgi:peptidoglycan/LPS O-acetylase OafA/YrhL